MTIPTLLEIVAGIIAGAILTYCAGHGRGYRKALEECDVRHSAIQDKSQRALMDALEVVRSTREIESKLDALIEWMEERDD